MRRASLVLFLLASISSALGQDSTSATNRGAQTVPADPFSGWTLKAGAQVARPQPVDDTPPPRDPPTRPTEPSTLPDRPRTEVQIAEDLPPQPTGASASCPSPSLVALFAVADSLTARGEYVPAQACLRRHLVLDPDDARGNRLYDLITRYVAADSLLLPAEKTLLDERRTRVRREAESGETDDLMDEALRVLAVLRGDPATVRLLQARLATTISPREGPSLAFVYVPGRTARPLGSPDPPGGLAEPERGFLLSETEVTNAQFAHFLNGIRTSRRPYLVPLDRLLHLRQGGGGRWEPKPGSEDLPVVDATWYGAQAYAEFAGGRLPTWDEWRWAYLMGGEETRGMNLRPADGASRLRATASDLPDALGVYDLLGNAAEWLYRDATSDERLVAGGAYSTTLETLQSSLTIDVHEMRPNGLVGFRVYRPVSVR